MGRRKIAIEPITEERNRTVTFVKRKAGLFKKAHELSILCQVDVLVIIVGHNHKVYEYSSSDTQDLLNKYNSAPRLQESKRPKDYGDYDEVSRISEFPGKRKNKLKKSIKDVKVEDEDEEEDGEEEEEEEEDLEEGEDDDEEGFLAGGMKNEDEADEDEDELDSTKSSLSSRLRKRHNETPSKPSKLRKFVSSSQLTDQSRIQSTFQHQRVLLQQQQQLYGSLPPLSSFPVHPSPQLQYHQPQSQQSPLQQTPTPTPTQTQTQIQPQQQQQQYAPSPAYSTSSSNGGGGGGTNKLQSQRPILRVKIPSSSDHGNDQDTNNEGDEGLSNEIGTKKNDSAMTLTAMDSSKGAQQQRQQQQQQQQHEGLKMNIENGQLAPPKPILPGLGIQSNNGQPGIPNSSSKSTPISATAMSGLFILPQPQPSPSGSHTNNIFLSPFNNSANTGENAQNGVSSNPGFRPQQQLYNGETPLSALPSKYLNNDLLFLSPSNFYSSEWNIPFGGGGTPIMPNRFQQQQLQQLQIQQQQQQQVNLNPNLAVMVPANNNSNSISGGVMQNENIRLASPSQAGAVYVNSAIGGSTGGSSTRGNKKRKN